MVETQVLDKAEPFQLHGLKYPAGNLSSMVNVVSGPVCEPDCEY